jgi:uncharacterized protein
MTRTIAEIETILRRELPVLRSQYAVASLGLFGSRVRHEESADSDLDVLVSFDRIPSFFRYIELEERLTELLGLKVDLVMRDALKPRVRENVLAELVPV